MPFIPPENPGRVRAKMYVNGVEYTNWGSTVKLQVVSRGEDNKEWSAATPSGSLQLTIKNDAAADQFAPGQEWFVDLVPIPPERAGAEGME